MTPTDFEKIIIQFLFKQEELRDKILPFLRDKLFDDFDNKHLVSSILKFVEQEQRFPKIKELQLFIKDKKIYDHLISIMDMKIDEEFEKDFLVENVEGFFRTQLVNNLLYESAAKIEETGDVTELGDVADKFRDAFSFSFNNKIGLDVLSDFDEIYQAFHDKERTISTGLGRLNRSLAGGFHEKSLCLFLAGTNVGKTLIKSSMACEALRSGKNTLFITLEESRKKISKRMVANLFDIPLKDIPAMTKEKFMERQSSLKNQFQNHLVIEEFPAHSLSANKLRSFLKDLKTRKKFEPDIVFIDYLGLVAPNREKSTNKRYEDFQRVAEEIRALSLERDFMPIVSSLQTNRDGLNSSSLSLTNMSESLGPAFTADAIYAVTQSEEMRDQNMYTFQNLKTRYTQDKNEIFYIGVDYGKMRLYDTEDQPPEDLNNTIQSAMGNTSYKNISGYDTISF